MKSDVSRLKIFDLESMSDCTPHATGIRATERIPRNFKRWFSNQHFRDLKVFVMSMVSSYGLGDLWTLIAGRVQQVGIDNPINAPENSTSPCNLYFTGRASTL